MREHVTKKEDQIYVQLWHGTPLKRMLYDSEKAEIITKNKTNIWI